jgi:hypothetical protein
MQDIFVNLTCIKDTLPEHAKLDNLPVYIHIYQLKSLVIGIHENALKINDQ